MRRHRFTGLLVVAFLGSVLVGAPAGGAEQQGTECSGKAIMTFTPGLSDQPSSGTHSGREGKSDCNGPMATEWDGRYGTQDPDMCSKGGEGWGVATHTVTTADGPQSFDAVFTFQYLAISNGLISGNFQGDYFSGTFQLKPLEGDCVSSPVTKAELTFRGTSHEQRGAKHVIGILFLV
jgi:hypothetical protein